MKMYHRKFWLKYKRMDLFGNLSWQSHHYMIFLLKKLVKVMNKFWTVLVHTYLTRLKSKAFIISTFIVLLGLFIVANLPSVIDIFSDEEIDQVAVIDHSNELF